MSPKIEGLQIGPSYILHYLWRNPPEDIASSTGAQRSAKLSLGLAIASYFAHEATAHTANAMASTILATRIELLLGRTTDGRPPSFVDARPGTASSMFCDGDHLQRISSTKR
jgi:hypothetical protein